MGQMRSRGWGPQDRISGFMREGQREREGESRHAGTQQEGGHAQGRKQTPPQAEAAGIFIANLPASRTARNSARRVSTHAPAAESRDRDPR